MFSEKNTFTQEEIIKPVPAGQTFSGYFTRRKKTKTGEKQYYLYSLDCENLILSSRFCGHHKISLSALEFSHTSSSFLSTSRFSGKDVLFADTNGKLYLGVTINSIGEKARLCRGVSIQFYSQNGKIPASQIQQRQPKLEGDVYVLRFPKFAAIPSEKNVILDYNGEYCFVFEKMEQDEFYISIRYPLSILQGFDIGLALMKKKIDD